MNNKINNKIDKEWFKEAIFNAGFNTITQFAKSVGLDSIKLSFILNGTRQVKTHEIENFAKSLHKTPIQIRKALGEDIADKIKYYLNMSLNNDDSIRINNAKKYIELPFFYYTGNLIEINTDSLISSNLSVNDIICFRKPISTENHFHLIKEPMIICRENGEIQLKRVSPSENNQFYHLISLNPKIPPVVDVKIKWAASIDFIIPSKNYINC